jgi:hypothetical protein
MTMNPELNSPWALPDPDTLRNLLTDIGLSTVWIEHLTAVGAAVFPCTGDWAAWQKELDALIEGRAGNIEPTRGFDWQLLALAVRMSRLTEKHSACGIDRKTTAATLFDLVRWAEDVDGQTAPGRALPLKWFGNHLHRNLLEIGCLQFVPGSFGLPFQLFRRTDGIGDPLALALGDIPCDAKGWPDEQGSSFVTAFCENAEGFSGHPLRAETGAISSENLRLSAHAWEPILTPGDPVLHVHIPKGSLLSENACRDAFQGAERIYKEAFPEIPWRAFCCTTWMLDPALDQLLDPESRIRAFARQFRRATIRGSNGRQILERVLGKAPGGAAAKPMTSLQRKVREHLAGGGVFRTTGGYRLPIKLGPPTSPKPQASRQATS